MRRRAGFTLLEIAISVAILIFITLIAVPSLRGVLADRRLQRSLDAMNQIVRQAQERSVQEHRAYLIEWKRRAIILHPESIREGESASPVSRLALDRGHTFVLSEAARQAAAEKKPLPQWIFWPSGVCELANVQFKSSDGSWEVNYSPLTARPEIVRYAAR